MNGVWLCLQGAPSVEGRNGHKDRLGPLGNLETVMEGCEGAVGMQGRVGLTEWGDKHEEASQKMHF